MGRGRRSPSWGRAVELVMTVACLAAAAAPHPLLAQGRSTTTGPAVANGRGTGAGRQSSPQLVPLRIAPCATGPGTCGRVVRASAGRLVPTVLARGDDLRDLAAQRFSPLMVFICPCGAPCLEFNAFGWQERNLGWTGPSGGTTAEVPINFHFARGLSQFLVSRERLDFRVKWSRAIDGTGARLSEPITSYGGAAATPATGVGPCP